MPSVCLEVSQKERMLTVNCRSSSSCPSSHPYFASVSDNDMSGSVLNMSPRIPSDFNPLERTLPDQASICWDSKMTVGRSINSIPSYGTPTPKSSAELREEISTLESEIMHLERYILSLYRTTFEEHVTSLPDTPGPYLKYKIEPSPTVLSRKLHHKMEQQVCRGGPLHHEKMSPTHSWASSDNQSCAANLKSSSRPEKW